MSLTCLYKNHLSIVIRVHHPLHHGEGRPEAIVTSLHLHRQALLLLCSEKRRELPGVGVQLRVSEVVQRCHVGQMPLGLHQQGQLIWVRLRLQRS